MCVCVCFSGWWFQPILKNMKVNGKNYPNYYGKIKHVPNHHTLFTLCDARSVGETLPVLGVVTNQRR